SEETEEKTDKADKEEKADKPEKKEKKEKTPEEIFAATKLGVGYFLGWYDGAAYDIVKDIEKEKGENTDGQTLKKIGTYLLRNNNWLDAEKYFNDSYDKASVGLGSIFNLARLTKEANTPFLSVSRTMHTNSIITESAAFADQALSWTEYGVPYTLPADGIRQPWELYQYQLGLDPDGNTVVRPIYLPQERTITREVLDVKVNHPGLSLFWGLEGRGSFNFTQTTFNGLEPASGFFPYMNESTPLELRPHYGETVTWAKFSPLYSQKFSGGLALPLFDKLPEVPWLLRWLTPIMVSKLGVDYELGLNQMWSTQLLDHKVDQNGGLSPTRTEKSNFSAYQHKVSFTLLPRTLALGSQENWSDTVYFSPRAKFTIDSLHRNKDIFVDGERAWKAPMYIGPDELTSIQRDAYTADHAAYMEKREENPDLGAKTLDLGLTINMPGFVEFARKFGLTDKLGFDEGSDLPISIGLSYSKSFDDYLRGLDVINPAFRNHYAEMYLNSSGQLVKNGANVHEQLDPYNGYSMGFSIRSKVRVGDLGQMYDAIDILTRTTDPVSGEAVRTYFDGDEWALKNFYDLGGYMKIITRAAWLLGSIPWTLVKRPVLLPLDNGDDNSFPIYLEPSYSMSKDWYQVRDPNTQQMMDKEGYSHNLSLTLGIGDNISLRASKFYTNNNHNFSNEGWDVALSYRFYSPFGAAKSKE
ncbi:hypothetical protein ACFLZ2_04755, partial [Candidatus Margulisiibacteriota bacterium]